MKRADLRINPEESTADILAFYERARAAADQVISNVDLDEVGTGILSWHEPPSLPAP